jgi:hypothetical protein
MQDSGGRQKFSLERQKRSTAPASKGGFASVMAILSKGKRQAIKALCPPCSPALGFGFA